MTRILANAVLCAIGILLIAIHGRNHPEFRDGYGDDGTGRDGNWSGRPH